MHRQWGRESGSNKNKDGQERGAMEANSKEKGGGDGGKKITFINIYIYLF